MQVQFNKPITLGKTTYGKGQHTVPVEDAQGWFFDALVKDGSVIVLRDEPAKQMPVAEPEKPAVEPEKPKTWRKGRRKAEPQDEVASDDAESVEAE